MTRFISLCVTIVIAMLIAILYPLELISDQVFKGFVAALIGSIILSEALQWREYRSDLKELLEDKLQKYDQLLEDKLKESSLEIRHILDSTIATNQILKLNSSKESYEYLTKRILETETQILDATLGPNIYTTLREVPEYRLKFGNAKKQILQENRINYKHIAIVNNVSRLERIKRELSYSANYFVGILDSTDELPKISFFIIDDKEVVIGNLKLYDSALLGQDIAISNPAIVNLFIEYFNLLWVKCKIIKDSKTKTEILSKLEQRIKND